MTSPTPRDLVGCPAAEELLARWIGLDAGTIGAASIARAVRNRMDALRLTEPAAAVDRALADPAERDRLVEEVVVGESWFFRYPQVFAFVARFVAARASLPDRGPVRILSAPCAGGEEPYSMAMALLDAGVAADRFSIDAVDVSHAALDRAGRAWYSANAFRNADLAFRDRWFQREGSLSTLDETVRRQVRFAWANLLDEAALATLAAAYDVVFCRNLLIYLTTSARAALERTLDRLVAADGLLVVGAAEPPILGGQWIPAGDGSVFALRRGIRTAAPVEPVRPQPRATSAPPTARADAMPATPAAPVTAAVPPAARSLDEVLREAGTLANARRFAAALAVCEAHARSAGPAPELFFLMGMVHQSAGDPDRAEGCFHKTLYLDASHDEALLALALLAGQRGDAVMAEHYRRSAARIHDRKGTA